MQFIRKKNQELYFNDAKKWSSKIFLENISLPIITNFDIDQALRNTNALYFLISLFQCISNAYNKDIKNIKKAITIANVLSMIISNSDPMNLFILKTEILYNLFKGNLKAVKESCQKMRQKLKYYSSNSQLLEQFINKVERWCDESEKRKGRKFTLFSELIIDNKDDPWEYVFIKIIATEMIKDYEKHIVNSEAILLVEGDTELSVLSEFAKKILGSDNKISLIDMEGFANMVYYAEAKIIRNFLKIPLFVIFDGDVSRRKNKEKIEKQLRNKKVNLPKSHIIFLKKNSIEDYLLVPAAIKRAFPSAFKTVDEIESFLQKNMNKRNKKTVLDSLFKQANLGKFDKEKAALIASKMNKDEIDKEIIEIFNFIIKEATNIS